MTSPPQCGRPAALWSRVWGCGGKSLVSSCRAADLEALMVGPLFHLKDGEGSAELTSLQPLSCPLAHTETHIQPHTHTHTPFPTLMCGPSRVHGWHTLPHTLAAWKSPTQLFLQPRGRDWRARLQPSSKQWVSQCCSGRLWGDVDVRGWARERGFAAGMGNSQSSSDSVEIRSPGKL